MNRSTRGADHLAMMLSCPQCEGFVPAKIHQCPHCEHALAASEGRARGRGRGLATKLGVSLLVSSTAMTLMACYGAPGGYCDYDPACEGYGSWSDSGTSGDDAWDDDDDGGWEDTGDTGEPEDDDGGEDEDTDTDTDGEEDEACATSSQREVIEDQELPVVVMDELELGPGTSQGTCGGSGNERIYLWKPPTSDDYLVSLESPADLVVYARIPESDYGGSCGEEIGCAAHSEGAVGQRLRLGLEELRGGEPILLIVDGAAPEQAGPFTLSIDPL